MKKGGVSRALTPPAATSYMVESGIIFSTVGHPVADQRSLMIIQA